MNNKELIGKELKIGNIPIGTRIEYTTIFDKKKIPMRIIEKVKGYSVIEIEYSNEITDLSNDRLVRVLENE